MEVLVQDTSLTATANAIREKTGRTGLIKWVANRGFSEEISSILNAAYGFSAIASGEYTKISDSSSGYFITHNLGVIPNVLIIIAKSALSEETYSSAMNIRIKKPMLGEAAGSVNLSARTIGSGSFGGGGVSESAWASAFTTTTAKLSASMLTGHTYLWIVGVIDGLE